MATVATLNSRLRDVMEREGLGPSVWRKRDCITLVRAVIRELSGQEPTVGWPAWAEGLDEQEAIRRAPREHGTLRRAFLDHLRKEPLLSELPKGTLPRPGMIGLTTVRSFQVDRSSTPAGGPLLGVIGPDCALWVRTHAGLRRAHPVAMLWEIR